MNHRERFLTALDHAEPDRVPRWAWIDAPATEELGRRTGQESPAEYWDFDIRDVGFLPPDPLPDLKTIFGHYFAGREKNWTFDWRDRSYGLEWGVPSIPAGLYGLSAPVSPMADLSSAAELAGYPFPNYLRDWRHDHLEADVRRWHDAGYPVNAGLGWLFQTAWTLRGREQAFIDLYDNPELADALLTRITGIRKAQAVRLAEAGVDSISMYDDIGSQRSMMISPSMWRKWLKPRMTELIEIIHNVNPDIHFRYHTDGHFMPVVPDLIEIGVSTLMTVQPECMDIYKIKRRFGQHISIEGTIGCQSELAVGTPEDVRRMVRTQFDALMPGGGFVASTANGVGADTPFENLETLFEAIEEYGAYPRKR